MAAKEDIAVSNWNQELDQSGTSTGVPEEAISNSDQTTVTQELAEDITTKISTKAESNEFARGKGPQKTSCSPRPRGSNEEDFFYEKSFILKGHEGKEREYKLFVNCDLDALTWKMMYKAKTHICAWLNAAIAGTLYFGVANGGTDEPQYQHGEILGLDVENIRDKIKTTFQDVLDDHIKSDVGPLNKGGDQNCVEMYFVPVKIPGASDPFYVIEIEVERDWRFCKDNIYYCRTWTEVSSKDRKEAGKSSKKRENLRYWFHPEQDKWDDAVIRTNARSDHVKPWNVHHHIKEPLQEKYQKWLQETDHVQPGRHSPLNEVPAADGRELSEIVKTVNKVTGPVRNLFTGDEHVITINGTRGSTNGAQPQFNNAPVAAAPASAPSKVVNDIEGDIGNLFLGSRHAVNINTALRSSIGQYARHSPLNGAPPAADGSAPGDRSSPVLRNVENNIKGAVGNLFMGENHKITIDDA